jgi:hypothetical protein
MRVAVIGKGNVGRALAPNIAAAHHFGVSAFFGRYWGKADMTCCGAYVRF